MFLFLARDTKKEFHIQFANSIEEANKRAKKFIDDGYAKTSWRPDLDSLEAYGDIRIHAPSLLVLKVTDDMRMSDKTKTLNGISGNLVSVTHYE